MKRLATHILVSIIAVVALSGCSRNNGDIGLWFGLWHVDSIEVDGVPDEAYDGNYYMLFQGKVFCIRWVDEQRHEYYESFAQWQEGDDGNTMTIDFADNRFPPQVDKQLPPTYLSVVTHFNVVTLTSTTMVLTTVYPTTGATITYRLTQWR